MVARTRKIHITTDYITLGQLLKFGNFISNGAEAKIFLVTHQVFVNKELDCRRGRKLRVGDQIEIESEVVEIN